MAAASCANIMKVKGKGHTNMKWSWSHGRVLLLPAWDCMSITLHRFSSCVRLTFTQNDFFYICQLFHTIKASNILAFIREIGFYHHI